MESGWIRIHRKMLDSPVMSDDWICRLWVACLLKANWQDGWFRMHRIPAGSFAFAYRTWAAELKVSVNRLKRGLILLKNSNQIELKTVRKSNTCFSVLTVCNWETYQNPKNETDTPTDTRTDTPTNTRTDTPTDTDIRKEEGNKKKKEIRNTPKPPEGVPSAEEFFDRWNRYVSTRPRLKPAIRLTKKRRDKIATRLRDPAWWEAFCGAVKLLPLAGDGWQPTFDWMIANEDNAVRVLEGEFEWRTDSEAVQKSRERRRKREADERIKRIAEQKKRDKAGASEVSKAINGILHRPNGANAGTHGASLLFGSEDDSCANGAAD